MGKIGGKFLDAVHFLSVRRGSSRRAVMQKAVATHYYMRDYGNVNNGGNVTGSNP